MSIPILGSVGSGGIPFSRSFFNAAFGEVLARVEKDQAHRLTLFLLDGSALDVCSIDGLGDQYLAVSSYVQGESAGEGGTSLNLVPYGLIYRIEIAPRGAEGERLGFRWAPAARRPSPGKKSLRRLEGLAPESDTGDVAPQD